MSLEAERQTLVEPAHISRYRRGFQKLDRWLSSLSMLGCVVSARKADPVMADVNATLARFQALSDRLVAALMVRHWSVQEMRAGAPAQVAANILVRNLFERSADICFLATDEVLRDFLDADTPSVDDDRVLARLSRYVAKYSVYDDVLLLDRSGQVRCRLGACPQAGPDEALLRKLEACEAGYVEVYRPTPLLPHKACGHLFAAPVTRASGGEPLGYLCLSFDLDGEMRAIFDDMTDRDRHLVLLDADGRVAASSLAALVPGTRPMLTGADGPERVWLQGGWYYCRTLPGAPYQGYQGLGWHCMALVAEEEEGASGADGNDTLNDSGMPDDNDLLAAGSELAAIQLEAAGVSHRLRLAVFNGRVAAVNDAHSGMTPVLRQIESVIEKIQQIFVLSVGTLQRSLYRIVAADTAMRAFSIINLMDRNLYERANDVRWWALDRRITASLAAASAGDDIARRKIADTLASINALYTVYTDILVADSEDRLVAGTADGGPTLPSLPETLQPLMRSTGTHDDQAYRVSPFEPSPLYAERCTYHYLADIVDPQTQRPLGRLVTVFDAENEFRAIVHDHLPAEGQGLGLIVDTKGLVIAAEGLDLAPGERLDPALGVPLSLRNGERHGWSVMWQGRQLILSAVASSSYREYKKTDGYRNDLIAVVGLPLV